MSRYIDKDKLLNRLCGNDISRMEDYYYNAILDEPEADVVEVIRCKDCKYYDEIYSRCLGVWDISEHLDADVNEDDYCSYGERKENEQ